MKFANPKIEVYCSSSNRISLKVPSSCDDFDLRIDSKPRYDELVRNGCQPSKIIEALLDNPDLDSVAELLQVNYIEETELNEEVGLAILIGLLER